MMSKVGKLGGGDTQTLVVMRSWSSKFVWLNEEVYNCTHLIQCGHLDCVQFAGRNDRREAAIAKLKSHWQKEHESSEQVFN